MADVITETTQQETTQQQTQQNQQQESNKTNLQVQQESIDVEKIRTNAVSEYLKSLGVEDSDTLKGIVTKHKEDEEANKSDLQKKDDALTATTKELAAEREARIIAEAKLSAIKLGAKPELVEDLVIVAKSKVTKDKDINAVIAEMKEGTSGKVYFADEEEEEEESKTKNKTVTRARVTKPAEKKEEKKEESKTETKRYEGTMAERIFSNRKPVKNHYFKN